MRLLILLLVLASSPALAQDTSGPQAPAPWLHLRARAGFQFFPIGVMAEGMAVPSAALHRADSLVFQRTYIGMGAYLRATPSFLDIGPRFSVSPIDIFEFHAMGILTVHWPSANGRVPFDTIASKTYDDRQVHPHEDYGVVLTVGTRLSPVLKLKLGPVIAVYGATLSYHHLLLDPSVAADQLIYDPALDLLIQRRSWTFEQQAALLVQLLDGESTKARLRLGATVRQRLAIESGDESLNLGFIGMFKPGRAPVFPDLLLVVTPYLRDTDRVMGPPWMFVGATWEFNPPLKRADAASEVAAALLAR